MSCTYIDVEHAGGGFSRVGSINLHQGLSLVLTQRVHSLACIETLLITFFRIQFEDTCFSTGGNSSHDCRQRSESQLRKGWRRCFFLVLTFSAIACVPYEAESLIKMAQGSILTATCCKEIKASETAIEVQAMQGERRKKDKLLRCTGMHCKED